MTEQIKQLRYERKWLIEQLAAAWEWTEQEVSQRLYKDVRTHFDQLSEPPQ